MPDILTKFRLLRPSYAIIDGRGTILRVNAEWKQFGRASGLTLPDFCVGACYFDHCPPSLVGNLADRLKRLASGQLPVIMYLYPCHSPETKRWFVMLGMSGEHGRPKADRATVVHIDVTELLLGQRADVARQLAADIQAALPLAAEPKLVNVLYRALNDYFGDLVEDDGEANHRRANHVRNLTKQEERVAELLSQGCSNDEIAVMLGCSVNTTKRHVSAILRKLGLESRTKVAVWYHQRASAPSEMARKP